MPNAPGTKHGLGIAAAPFIRAPATTARLMLYVCAALLPGVACCVYFWGYGVLWQLSVTLSCGVVCELLVCLLRRRSPALVLGDCSFLITALLLALTLPPLMPWYYTAAASAFAFLVVKHCFGGLGMNIFNPAMAGYVFLMISAPGMFFGTSLTPGYGTWELASSARTFAIVFQGQDPGALRQEVWDSNAPADRLSGATYLEAVKTARKSGHDHIMPAVAFLDPRQPAYHAYAFMGAAWMLGGLGLWFLGVIMLQLPVFFLATVALCGAVWHYLEPGVSLSASEHLLCGGTMLAAFFIITDPVTTCGTARGRITFAILCGLLVVVNRVQGSYSDAVAFAVLLANCCAPLIDVITRRRPYGADFERQDIL